MPNPYEQGAAIAAPWAAVGKSLFQGQANYEAGRSKMADALAREAMMQSHTGLYNAQAQKAQQEAANLEQRRQYQSPEFANRIAANLAGLSEQQGGDLVGFQSRNNWGVNPARELPADQAGPPVPELPKSAPSWYSPQVEQRFNQARGAHLANLGGTGNTTGEQVVKSFVDLLQRNDYDASKASPEAALAYARSQYAQKGGAPFHQGTNGVMNVLTGAETLNDVGKSAAMENRAQAGNASASAALHRAQIPEVQARTELTKSKIGAATVNPDGSITTPAGKPVKLSATAEKELFEADDNIKATDSTIGLLKQAKELNDKAYSGYFAKSRAVARSNLPGESEQANATIQLDNIMTTQALESLKATFGAAPTEGERKILLDIQASADKTPKQRAEIIDRAVKAAEKRMRFNVNKAKALRSGTYNTADPQQRPSNDPIDDLLKKYGG